MSGQWNPRRRVVEKGIYILALLFQNKKIKKKKKKKKKRTVVLVPHLLVPVPPGEFGPN